jgi:hypothetical protein
MLVTGSQRSWPLQAGSVPHMQTPVALQLLARMALQGTHVLPPLPQA